MAKISNMAGLIGDKELQKTILSLTDNCAKKIMRPSIVAGLKPIRKEARANADSKFKSDSLSRLIGIKAKAKKDKVFGKVFMRPDKSGRTIKIKGKEVPFEAVANIQEFGRKDGSLEPHAFMRPAADSKRTEALKEVENKARELLPKVVKEARAKGKAVYLMEGE